MSSHTPFDIIVQSSGPLGGYVAAPPSKNFTTRLVLGAALSKGESILHRPATNDDARALIACCRALGASITEEARSLRIRGVAGHPVNPGRLNPGNAGAVLRLLLGTACLCEGEVEFVTDFHDSLGKRPNEDLLYALRQLGAEAEGQGEDGRLPIRIAGGRGRVRGGTVTVSGQRSSQFLSALLYLAPWLDGDSTIIVRDEGNVIDASGAPPTLVSAPLIDQTLEALGQFGLALRARGGLEYFVPGGQCGEATELTVNADWPSAAALLSAVAVGGGMATIYGLAMDAQGERRAEEALAAMGCGFSRPRAGELIVHSKVDLQPIRFNGDLATDAVLALVAAACFAQGTSRFEGIGNLRLKECDRIREPLEELAKLGVRARSGPDWIEIDGAPEGYAGGVEVDSRGDHRVAQMLAIVGLRCERGLVIRRAEHISKSYPGFFTDLARLGAHVESVAPGRALAAQA